MAENTKILVVDDNQDDIYIFRRILKKVDETFILSEVHSASEVLTSLQENEPDIVFVDYLLPDGTGIDILKNIKQRQPRLPVVMLTGSGNEQIAVESFQAGADDYIIKGHADPSLIERIIYHSLEHHRYNPILNKYNGSEEFVDSLPVMIWTTDQHNRFTYVNEEFASFLNHAAKDLRGQSLLALMHPEDRTTYQERFTKALQERARFNQEVRIQVGDDYQHVLLYAKPYYSNEGSISGLIGSIEDISADIANKKALETHQARYQAISTSQFDAIISTDLEGRINSVNARGETLLNFVEPELQSRRIWVLFHNSVNFRDVQQQLMQSSQEGLYLQEVKLVKRDGATFVADVMITPIQNANTTLGYLYTIRDMTAHIQNELMLNEISRTLAQSREQERKRVARDLHKGPLQKLLTVSSAMQTSLDNGTNTQDYVQHVKHWYEQLDSVIKHLQTAIYNLRPADIDEFGLKVAIERYLERFANTQSFDIDFNCEDFSCEGQSFDNEEVNLILYRVVQEAIDNIIKHAEASKIQIRLLEYPNEFRLFVEDDGKGFVVPKNLNEFLKDEHFGLLGLAESIKLQQGSISVHSSLGTGTEITVEIPKNPKLMVLE